MSEHPERGTVVVVGGDLMAHDRIEQAATAANLRIVRLGMADLESLEEPPEANLVVLDLDVGGRELVATWARIAGGSGPRTVGYFSHIDVKLGREARANRIEAFPRGRFWRTLVELLESV